MKYLANLFLKIFGIVFLYFSIMSLIGIFELVFIVNTEIKWILMRIHVIVITFLFGFLLVFKTHLFIKYLKLDQIQENNKKSSFNFELKTGIQLLGLFMFFSWINKTVELVYKSYEIQYSAKVIGININKAHSFLESFSNPSVIAGILSIIISVLMIFNPTLIIRFISKFEKK